MQAVPRRPKTERLFVFVYIFLACLTLAHAIYYAYSAVYLGDRTHPGLTQEAYSHLHNTTALSADHPIFSGTDHAPNQYRIGVEYPVKFLADKLSIRKYYIVYSVIDFAAGIATCGIFYFALCRSAFFQRLDSASQTLVVALFLASLAYPLAWVVPWLRPETLPSALYLALMLNLLGRVRGQLLWLVPILLATAWQGFIRSDVPIMFGLALGLFSLTSRAEEIFGSRKLGIASGFSIFVLALAIQAYLKLILFPHATYPPDTSPITFLTNFNIRVMTTFAVAILPYVIILILAAKYREILDARDILVILASLVYLPLWLTLGVAIEVRIFVPFLLALTPTASKLMLMLLNRQAPQILARGQ